MTLQEQYAFTVGAGTAALLLVVLEWLLEGWGLYPMAVVLIVGGIVSAVRNPDTK